MDRDSTDSTQGGLCKMGCGFFGNQSFEGMCSKCFKEVLKRKQQPAQMTGQSSTNNTPENESLMTIAAPNVSESTDTVMIEPGSSEDTSNRIEICDPDTLEGCASAITTEILAQSGSSTTEISSEIDNTPEKPKKRNRCFMCKKKVGLTGFDCRCGGVYCGLHRYSNEHACTFDYKADGRAQLASANPVVQGEKIRKI